MALKAFIDDIETVDETLRGLYVQDGDVWKLDAEGVEDVSGLKSALDKERKRAKDLERQTKKFNGIDPEKIAQLRDKDIDVDEYIQYLEDADARADADAMKNGEWDKLKQKMVDSYNKEKTKLLTAHTEEVESLQIQLKAMQKTLESELIIANGTAEIHEAKGEPALLLPIIRNQTKMIRDENEKYKAVVIGDDGEPRLNSKGEHVTIKELVREMRQSDQYARAFDGTGTSGSGTLNANPGGTGRRDLSKLPPIERLKIARQQGA